MKEINQLDIKPMSGTVKEIMEKAKNTYGATYKGFRQNDYQWEVGIRGSAGVCITLSSYWMLCHTKHKDLLELMLTSSKEICPTITELQLATPQAFEELDLYLAGKLNCGGLQQVEKQFFTFAQYTYRQLEKEDKNKFGNDDQGKKKRFLFDMAQAMTNPNAKGNYVLIDITMGQGLGHAMCVHLTKDNKVLYFDPNGGNLLVSEKEKFCDWFAHFFLLATECSYEKTFSATVRRFEYLPGIVDENKAKEIWPIIYN